MALVIALAALEPGFAAARAADVPVYLVSHGWHVGLVLRREDVTA